MSRQRRRSSVASDYKYPLPDKSRFARFRDGLVRVVCNLMLRHVATEWYRKMIEGSILYGLDAVRKESREERAVGFNDWIKKEEAE